MTTRSAIGLRAPASFSAAALCATLLGLCAPAARAGLVEGVDSIANDRALLRSAVPSVTVHAAYQRHELITADGARVREYVSAAGTVFAVSWSGSRLPDLKTLLASHYAEFTAAAAASRHNHHVFTLATPELVLHSVRLPRGFIGGAYLPGQLPAGTAPSALD